MLTPMKRNTHTDEAKFAQYRAALWCAGIFKGWDSAYGTGWILPDAGAAAVYASNPVPSGTGVRRRRRVCGGESGSLCGACQPLSGTGLCLHQWTAQVVGPDPSGSFKPGQQAVLCGRL